MSPKVLLALVVILAGALVGSVYLWGREKSARKRADEMTASALGKMSHAEEALAAMRQIKAQTDANLEKTKQALATAQAGEADAKESLPKLEAELSHVRRSLAEAQARGRPDAAVSAPHSDSKPLPVRKPASGWSVAQLLPPETLAVIIAHDAHTTKEKLAQTSLWQFFSAPEFAEVFRGPLLEAQQRTQFLDLMLGVKVSDLASYFSQGDITLALLSVQIVKGKPDPQPNLLLAVQLGEKADAFSDELNKRLDQARALLEDKLQMSSAPLGNTTLHKVVFPEAHYGFDYCMCDGTILLCGGEGREGKIERLLAMREKMKATAENPPPAAVPEVLAQMPSYALAQQKAGPDSDVTIWLNTEAFFKDPVLKIKPKNEQDRQAWELLGLSAVRAVSYSVGVRDKGLHELFFVDVPAVARRGVLGMIEHENADTQALDGAPKNSILAATFKITPDKFFDKFVEMAALADPNSRHNIAAALLAIGEQLEVDVKKEFLGALTGQMTFSLSVPNRNTKLAIGFPQPLLALQVKDASVLKTALRSMRKSLRDKLEFTNTAEGERQIVTVRERETNDGREPGQFSYVMDDHNLLLSLYPLALREELRRRAEKTGGAGLGDDANFNLARANLSGQPQGILYVDTAALAVAAYDLLIPIVQMRQRVPKLDLLALPTADRLAQHIGPSVFELNFDSAGVNIEGYSPAGFAALAIPTGMAVASFAKRNATGEDRKDQVLSQVARDLKSFAAEHDGKYPATLKEMQPKYLTNLTKELDQIVYLGKQDAANRVVAHSFEKLPGSVTALLQDGSIVTVSRLALGRTLQQGYHREAPQRGPAPAVKPPRPPDGNF